MFKAQLQFIRNRKHESGFRHFNYNWLRAIFAQVKLVIQLSYISLGIKELPEVLFGAWNPFDLEIWKCSLEGDYVFCSSEDGACDQWWIPNTALHLKHVWTVRIEQKSASTNTVYYMYTKQWKNKDSLQIGGSSSNQVVETDSNLGGAFEVHVVAQYLRRHFVLEDSRGSESFRWYWMIDRLRRRPGR